MKQLIILGILAAAPAQAADQFNLECVGKWRFDASETYAETSRTLRLDLKAMTYCEGSCFATNPIAEVQPNLIELEPSLSDVGFGGTVKYHRIDRTTGRYVHFVSQRRPTHKYIDVEMQCEAKPFTGFPKLPAKF